jgi:hypothetical protein
MEIDSQSTPRYERLLIAGLCVTAAVRIFVFSAAFPFFNNSDEQAHFDLVYKYSRGHLPSSPLEKFDPVSSKIIGDYGSPEFLYDPFSRPARWGSDVITAQYKRQDNHETWAWPTYYVLAGLWCRVGEVAGMSGKHLLYWIRFLNVPIGALFVWLSWLLSRKLFESDFRQRIAVPLLAAFFPQDIFYSITGDVLSPLVFAAAFIMLLEIYLGEKSRLYHLLTGLIVAAALLTKTTNIIIVVFAFVVFCIKLKQAFNQKQLKHYLACLSVFTVSFAVPVAFWLGRNYILFHDVVGSAAAMKMLTWTKKPFGEMFNHPILTPTGLITFLNSLIRTFWRGEFFWEGMFKVLAWGPMDQFYMLSSFLFLFASLLDIFIYKSKMSKPYRSAILSALFVLVMFVLMLAVLSMRYDFGTCANPSRIFPFFVSGRLIAGAILPFLLLYVCGLNRILTNLGLASYLLVAVAVIVIAITASEIFITMPVFASPYNWFHPGASAFGETSPFGGPG